MKLVAVGVVVGVVCVVLFLAGVFRPKRSRRMQERTGALARKAEDKGKQKGGKLGDVAQAVLRRSRHAADRSAEKGRQINERIWPK